MSTGVPAFIDARRSIRAFRSDAVDRALLDTLVEAACLAPAPHHSRPWRFVVVDSDAGTASWPWSRRMVTSFEPMSPLPPMTTIFIMASLWSGGD